MAFLLAISMGQMPFTANLQGPLARWLPQYTFLNSLAILQLINVQMQTQCLHLKNAAIANDISVILCFLFEESPQNGASKKKSQD